MRKARGGGGGGGALVAPKLFQARQVVIAECRKRNEWFVGGFLGGHQRLLRLQCAGGGPFAGSPQELQLDACLGLWKSSRRRRGPCEAWRLTQIAALQVQPEAPKAPKRFWRGSRVDRRAKRQ